MAKLPPFHRITLSDLPDAPSWVDRLLYLLNEIFQAIYSALNGNLNFTDNLGAQVKTFTIQAGATADLNTFRFPFSTRNRPENLYLGKVIQESAVYSPITSAVFVSWHLEGQEVVVDAIPGLTVGKIYTISVLVI